MEHRQTELPNGTKVFEFCDNRTHVFHFEFLACYGMDDELTTEMYESAHTLEHMMAKYTSVAFPHAHSNTLRLEGIGISKNAFTSSSMTGYYMEGSLDALPQALTLSANALAQFKIDPDCFDSELRAVENELRAIISHEWHEFDEFVSSKVYAGHPRSKTQQARLENVAKLTPAFLTQIYKRFYQPQYIRVILHGNKHVFEHREWRLFKQLLEKLPNTQTEKQKRQLIASTLTPGTYSFPLEKPNSHCKFTWTFPLHRLFSITDVAVLDCTTFLLSRGFASKLYHRLRTTLGLVYAINASGSLHPTNAALSTLSITATCTKSNIAKAIAATASELASMKDEPKECDMKRWRNFVRTSYFDTLSDTSVHSVINNIRMVARFDLPYVELKEHTEVYLRVTPSQVRDLCTSVFEAELKNGVLCYTT